MTKHELILKYRKVRLMGDFDHNETYEVSLYDGVLEKYQCYSFNESGQKMSLFRIEEIEPALNQEQQFLEQLDVFHKNNIERMKEFEERICQMIRQSP